MKSTQDNDMDSWVHTNAHNAPVIFTSQQDTTRQRPRQRQSDGKRFPNYILWFPHDTEFLVHICLIILRA